MKSLPKKIFLTIVPWAFFGILLAKPDMDNPFTYGHLSSIFIALFSLFSLIIVIAVDVYTRLVKLEKQQESAVIRDETDKAV